MLIYNTTYHCEQACYEEFLAWMRKEYIPVAMGHGGLVSPRISRIMGGDDAEGVSLSVQFETEGIDSLSSWYEACGEALVARLEDKFAQRVAGFSTIMERIDL